MTKQEFEKFLAELEKLRKMVCKHEHNDCDHNRCMACINGCYGDECAFDVVIESIERLERESNDCDPRLVSRGTNVARETKGTKGESS